MEKTSTRKEQSMKTRLKILDVALDLFKEKGIDSVKVTDICQAAGVSVGAFYHHFPSKESIIERCYQSIEAYIADLMQDVNYDNYTELLLNFLRTANQVMEEMDWNFIANVYKYLLTSKNKYTLSTTRHPYVFMEEILTNGVAAGEFRKDLDVKQTTASLMRLVRGLVFDWCISEGSYSLTDEVAKTVGIILKEYR
ncbi:MAG: TetR/AcrR family transcriptional regulator [Lachnospiraceae bacterium]|nr:TetR/AcrR family transcriptional regulator [Lachnospiraceae bacterium]MDD7378013.1 TetR/AcrR family transcriptional regulator [Lachnospiraceae bacterium]MDY4616995.1 TetR/AcrR family transcriptional regulator [Lachnospiraceae bacterium]